MTVTELRHLLEPLGIRPLKDRSQHFLLDERVVEAMADAAEVGEGTRALEIGPGPGILTAELLRRGANVVAVEIDKKLCTLLRERFGTNKNFHLLEGDALTVPNKNFTTQPLNHSATKPLPTRSSPPYHLIANLPYAITSATLQKFLSENPSPATITVMIQKEVADRILAKPGDMSALAVFVQTLARVRRVRSVAAGAFFPPPKVASAVIHMERRNDDELAKFFGRVPEDRYFDIVRQAFSSKRKQLKNTLRAIVPDEAVLKKAFIDAKISPSARPEELGPSDWAALTARLNTVRGGR